MNYLLRDTDSAEKQRRDIIEKITVREKSTDNFEVSWRHTRGNRGLGGNNPWNRNCGGAS